MLAPGERLLVACSGGADSVALFYLLREIASPLGVKLSLLHFDHRLRRESSRDFRFVEKLAEIFRVPFYGGRRRRGSCGQKGLSPEEAAREARYEFFGEVSAKSRIPKIALGHHQDDQAETVFMRLLQGTGLRGLQGIRPVARSKGLTLIRPLIEVSRDEIRKFLKKRKFPFREDRTNRSRQFLRNRIRFELLPLLERKFNPRIRKSLCRLAETAASEVGGLDDWIRKCWKDWVRSRRNGRILLERERFLSLPGILQFRLLDQMLRALDPRSGLDFDSWKKIERGLETKRFRMTLPKKLDLTLTPKQFSLQKES